MMNPTKKIIPFATFMLIASPQMFCLTRKVFGGAIASADGVPNLAGLALHALVFVILSHILWRLVYGPKKDSQSCGCSA
jgi:hypothetical protein